MTSTVVALARASRRRCPRCGTKLFERWLRIRAVCDGCGLLTDRGEDDYFLGAVLLNVIAAELIATGGAAAVVVVTWPDPAWRLALVGGLALAVVGPLVGYPYAKSVWLAVDMQLRSPVTAGGERPDA